MDTIINETKFAINTMDKYVHSFISIQGSIGAGKSTLLKSIREWISKNNMDALNFIEDDNGKKFLFIVIDEPVDIWTQKIYNISYEEISLYKGNNEKSALDLFYTDKSRFGFWFQIIAFTSRLKAIVDTLSKINFNDNFKKYTICIIAERSLRSDRLFFHNLYKSGWITQAELKVYDDFFDLICEHVIKKEDVMVYLNTTPQKCEERITKRARASEIGVTDVQNKYKKYDKLLWILFYVIIISITFPSMIPYTIIIGMIMAYTTLFENKTNKISMEYLSGIHEAHLEMIEEFDGRIIGLDFNNDLLEDSIDEMTNSLMNRIITDFK